MSSWEQFPQCLSAGQYLYLIRLLVTNGQMLMSISLEPWIILYARTKVSYSWHTSVHLQC